MAAESERGRERWTSVKGGEKKKCRNENQKNLCSARPSPDKCFAVQSCYGCGGDAQTPQWLYLRDSLTQVHHLFREVVYTYLTVARLITRKVPQGKTLVLLVCFSVMAKT